MESPTTLRNVITRQMLTTLLGFVAIAFGLLLSLSEGELVVIALYGVFTVLIGLVLINQIRQSVRQLEYL